VNIQNSEANLVFVRRILPRILLAVQEVAVVNRERITQTEDTLNQMMEKLTALHKSANISNTSTSFDTCTDSSNISAVVGSLESSNTRIVTAVESRSQLRIRTTLTLNRCDAFCNCQCDMRVRGTTPRWLQNISGILFFSYSGIPALNYKSCNSSRCQRSLPASTAQFRYYFPTCLG
jgi:hypothetical protein